jgi:hypothetical protein
MINDACVSDILQEQLLELIELSSINKSSFKYYLSRFTGRNFGLFLYAF